MTRNVLSNCQGLTASTAEPPVLFLCRLPGETKSKPLCTESCKFSAAAHAYTFTICFPHVFEINISLQSAPVQLSEYPALTDFLKDITEVETNSCLKLMQIRFFCSSAAELISSFFCFVT